MIEIPRTVIVARRQGYPDRVAGIYTHFEDLNWKLTDLHISCKGLQVEFRLYPTTDAWGNSMPKPTVEEMFEEGMSSTEYIEYVRD
ncbi:hypothetical protein [Cronobacter phage vB_Cdu_VP8]|nr:hypothetical protein [Cronobacter phage vB_Cdu_VP8]